MLSRSVGNRDTVICSGENENFSAWMMIIDFSMRLPQVVESVACYFGWHFGIAVYFSGRHGELSRASCFGLIIGDQAIGTACGIMENPAKFENSKLRSSFSLW